MERGTKGKRKVASPAQGLEKPRKIVKRRRGSSSRAAAAGTTPSQPAQPVRRSARLNPSASQISPSIIPPTSVSSSTSKAKSSSSKGKARGRPVSSMQAKESADTGQAAAAASKEETERKVQPGSDLHSSSEQFAKDAKKKHGDARRQQEQQVDPEQSGGTGKKRRLARSPGPREDTSSPPPPARPDFSQSATEGAQFASTPSPQGEGSFLPSIFGNWSYSLEIMVPPSSNAAVNEPLAPGPVVQLKIWDPSGQADDRMGGAVAHISIIASLYDETGTHMLRSPSSGGYISGIYMQTPQEEVPSSVDEITGASTSRRERTSRSATPEAPRDHGDGGLVSFATFDNLKVLKAGKFKLKFSAMATEVGNNSPSGQSQTSTEISEQQLGGSRCKAQVLSDAFDVV